MTEMIWTPLEHQIYRELKEVMKLKRKCLLMISGGADSVALFHIFLRLQSALKVELEVLHCHHGPTDSEQESYRFQAQQFVESLARKHQIKFHSLHSSKELCSEEEMRVFRHGEAENLRQERGLDWVVWAHHQNDFLETQILRLIRGSAPQAALEPMSLARGFYLRPLLKISREDIVSYLKNQNLEWIDDPSNQDESYLRNWLRNNWLSQLEEKCPGALKAFSRSLGLMAESLAESLDETFPEGIWLQEGISRPLFMTLSEAQKKQVLALYLRRLGQMDFTHNQIKEVLKHLDISQTIHTFKSAQLIWSLSKDVISAKSPFVVNAF